MVGQLAHIKGRKPGSPRYDPSQNPEERHGEDNLIAMCHDHGILIDADGSEYTYPVDTLQRMKVEHQQKIEGLADRNWIQPPNSVGGGALGDITVHYWIDRHGHPQVYSDDQLSKLDQLLRLSIDFSNLNTTMQALKTLNSPEVKSLLQQGYARVGEEEDNLYAHLVKRMAVAPEVTFGEFLHFLIEGVDATPLIDAGAKRRLDIVEGREPSFWRNKKNKP
jgi:hypothetical protein